MVLTERGPAAYCIPPESHYISCVSTDAYDIILLLLLLRILLRLLVTVMTVHSGFAQHFVVLAINEPFCFHDLRMLPSQGIWLDLTDARLRNVVRSPMG